MIRPDAESAQVTRQKRETLLHVEFEPFGNAVVKLHDDHEATVVLAGYVDGTGNPQARRAWRVRMKYDPLRAEWLPAGDAP